MDNKCQCDKCQLVYGKTLSGTCAICHHPGEFTAKDTFIIGEFELWAHEECRTWENIQKLIFGILPCST